MANNRKRCRISGETKAKISKSSADVFGQSDVENGLSNGVNDVGANTVKVRELSADAFRSEIELDVLSMIPAVADLLDDLPLQYVWDVDKVGLTIVIKPKEEVIDPAKLLMSSGLEGLEEEEEVVVKEKIMALEGGFSTMDEVENDDHDDDAGQQEALDYEDSNGFGRSEEDSSSSYDILRTAEKKLNLDAFAHFICDESKPLQTPWQKAQAKKDEEWFTALRENRIGDTRPFPPKVHIKKKMDFIKESRVCVEVVKKSKGNWKEAVTQVRDLLGKRSNNRPENWIALPVRIVTTLCKEGKLSIATLIDRVVVLFRLKQQCNANPRKGSNEVRTMATALEQLMVSGVVQCLDCKAQEQLFELCPFILDDGNNESEATTAAAANIAAVFNHRLFLDILDDVSDVLTVIEKDRVNELDSLRLWNREFADATLPQLITAAILFQDAPEEFIPLEDIRSFIEDCVYEKEMGPFTETSLIVTINCLFSMGVLEATPEGSYKLGGDLDMISDVISHMSTTELLDLSPPPVDLGETEMAILAAYLLDPFHTSVSWFKMSQCMETRLYPDMEKSPRGRLFKPWRKSFVEIGIGTAVCNGLMTFNICVTLGKSAERGNLILTNAMADALDRYFKQDMDNWTRTLDQPLVVKLDEDEGGRDVEVEEEEEEEEEGKDVEGEKSKVENRCANKNDGEISKDTNQIMSNQLLHESGSTSSSKSLSFPPLRQPSVSQGPSQFNQPTHSTTLATSSPCQVDIPALSQSYISNNDIIPSQIPLRNDHYATGASGSFAMPFQPPFVSPSVIPATASVNQSCASYIAPPIASTSSNHSQYQPQYISSHIAGTSSIVSRPPFNTSFPALPSSTFPAAFDPRLTPDDGTSNAGGPSHANFQ